MNPDAADQESRAQGVPDCGSAKNIVTPKNFTLGQRSAHQSKGHSHAQTLHGTLWLLLRYKGRAKHLSQRRAGLQSPP